MESLIDPVTTPFSTSKEIAAEIEEFRRLPDSAARDETIKMMEGWIEEIEAEASQS